MLSDKIVVAFSVGTKFKWIKKRFNHTTSCTVEHEATYSDSTVDKATQVCFLFDYPPLETEPIFGEVVRSTQTKAIVREVAIKFTKINTLDSKKINRLAIDYIDCENKIMLGALDVCRKECSYYNFCEKKLKIK